MQLKTISAATKKELEALIGKESGWVLSQPIVRETRNRYVAVLEPVPKTATLGFDYSNRILAVMEPRSLKANEAKAMMDALPKAAGTFLADLAFRLQEYNGHDYSCDFDIMANRMAVAAINRWKALSIAKRREA